MWIRCRPSKYKAVAESIGLCTPHGARMYPYVRRMAETGYPVEWNHVGKVAAETVDFGLDTLVSAKRSWPDIGDSDALREYLEDQPMGTHLYIAAIWEWVRLLVRIAETVGYAKEDIQIRGFGQKSTRFFALPVTPRIPLATHRQ